MFQTIYCEKSLMGETFSIVTVVTELLKLFTQWISFKTGSESCEKACHAHQTVLIQGGNKRISNILKRHMPQSPSWMAVPNISKYLGKLYQGVPEEGVKG